MPEASLSNTIHFKAHKQFAECPLYSLSHLYHYNRCVIFVNRLIIIARPSVEWENSSQPITSEKIVVGQSQRTIGKLTTIDTRYHIVVYFLLGYLLYARNSKVIIYADIKNVDNKVPYTGSVVSEEAWVHGGGSAPHKRIQDSSSSYVR